MTIRKENAMLPEKDVNEPSEVTRRSFLDLVLKGGVVVWLGAMVAPAFSYLWPAHSGGSKKSTISAGTAKDFGGVGNSKMVKNEGKPIMVIRTAEEGYKAFAAICPHLGCIVKWDAASKSILCPCHAGVFSMDGKVVSGPPPKPLPEYNVVVSGGEVLIKL